MTALNDWDSPPTRMTASVLPCGPHRAERQRNPVDLRLHDGHRTIAFRNAADRAFRPSRQLAKLLDFLVSRRRIVGERKAEGTEYPDFRTKV